MREIKFRAFDREMMHPVKDLSMFRLDNKDLVAVTISGGRIGVVGATNGFPILMQFTGLKDKNGKEIYEGDIVQWFDYRAVVKWRAKNMGFVLEHIKQNGFTQILTTDNYEIIGDIYSTPDLLSNPKDNGTQ